MKPTTKNEAATPTTPRPTEAMPERLHARSKMIYSGDDNQGPGKARLVANLEEWHNSSALASELVRRYNGFAEMEARVKGLEEAAGLAVSRMVDVFHDPGLSEANKKALFHEVQSLRRALGSK